MKCSGKNCPMQYPYDEKACAILETCPYATLIPYTNADHIRAMSDEELAEFLERVHVDSCSTCCDNLYWCRRNNAPEPFCQKHLFIWLQQPAEEET